MCVDVRHVAPSEASHMAIIIRRCHKAMKSVLLYLLVPQVERIKERVEEKEGIPPPQQR